MAGDACWCQLACVLESRAQSTMWSSEQQRLVVDVDCWCAAAGPRTGSLLAGIGRWYADKILADREGWGVGFSEPRWARPQLHRAHKRVWYMSAHDKGCARMTLCHAKRSPEHSNADLLNTVWDQLTPKQLLVGRAHFYSADSGRGWLAGHASFEELSALVAVFGLDSAQQLARSTEKPLQASVTQRALKPRLASCSE